jgi:catechol 2,3-dioxygenase-like lactoylglutathione lyase family enzyme
MLANSPIVAFVPTQDALRARAFYENTLGLRFVSDDNFAIVMDANGIVLRITRVGKFTPLPFTVLGWEVQDFDSAVAQISAQGVEFSRFGFLDQSDNGVWTAPGGVAKVAWFLDPDGNMLSLSQNLAAPEQNLVKPPTKQAN